MKECPNCKVIRENSDRYCECGYDLRFNILDETRKKHLVSSQQKFLIVHCDFTHSDISKEFNLVLL